MGTIQWRSKSVGETRTIGSSLVEELRPDGILLLEGDLGSGKTVLAQGVGTGLGIDSREIQSPTFTLVREHQGPGGELIHLDLYRLSGEEVAAVGVEEILAGPGLKVVEWPDRLERQPSGAVRIRIETLPDGARLLRRIADPDAERR